MDQICFGNILKFSSKKTKTVILKHEVKFMFDCHWKKNIQVCFLFCVLRLKNKDKSKKEVTNITQNIYFCFFLQSCPELSAHHQKLRTGNSLDYF